MIICPSCKALNEDGAGFCDQCGTTLAGLSANPSVQTPAPVVPTPGAANTCPSCGAPVIPGEAFCDNCGAALSLAGSVAAGPRIAPTVNPTVVAPAASLPVVMPPPQAVATARIVTPNGQSITLSGKPSYLIGREDPVSGIFPEIDTTASGGEDAGVSRRHAELIQQGGHWFLQALNTTNGTFVNQQKVAPNTRQPLNPGDQIRLGKWIGAFQVI